MKKRKWVLILLMFICICSNSLVSFAGTESNSFYQQYDIEEDKNSDIETREITLPIPGYVKGTASWENKSIGKFKMAIKNEGKGIITNLIISMEAYNSNDKMIGRGVVLEEVIPAYGAFTQSWTYINTDRVEFLVTYFIDGNPVANEVTLTR